MSMKRSKAKIIKGESSDEETGSLKSVTKSSSMIQPKKNKIKPKVKMSIQQLEDDLEDSSLDEVPFSIKRKDKSKNRLQLPKFQNFETDVKSYEYLIKDSDTLQSTRPDIDTGGIELQEEISSPDSKPNTLSSYVTNNEEDEEMIDSKGDEEIMLDMAHGGDNIDKLKESSGFKDDIDISQDLRLPLSNHEALIQQKLIRDEMESAFNEAEILGDPEVESADWENLKVKTGSMMNTNARHKLRPPKLKNVEEISIEDESKRLKEIVEQLKIKKSQLIVQFENNKSSREKFNGEKQELERQLEVLSSELNIEPAIDP